MEDCKVHSSLRLSARILQNRRHRASLNCVKSVGHTVDTCDSKIINLEACRLDGFNRAESHFVVLADHAVDFAFVCGQPVFHQCLCFSARPVCGLLFKNLHVRTFSKSLLVAFEARNLRRLANRALNDDDIAFAANLVENGLGFHVAGNRIIRTDIRSQKIRVYAGVGTHNRDVCICGCLNSGRTGFNIYRHENDRVELLGDHGIELFLLNERIIAPVENRQRNFTALDRWVLLQRFRPYLHEFSIKAVRGCANLELFLSICSACE